MKNFLILILTATVLPLLAQDIHFDGLRLRENKGMITVLEAPLFRVPDKNSKVVQYARKGEEIYIHPAEFQQDRYEGLIAKDPEDIASHEKKYAERFKDPLFDEGKDVYTPDPGSLFYKTLSSDGAEAYILKDHVFLLYNDLRELEQNVAQPDPTDYRIQEPLPKGFPLKQPGGRRGYVSWGMGVPSDAPYSYTKKIEDTGFNFFKELSVVWSSNADGEVTKRFFFGGMANLSLYDLEYKLENGNSNERNFKLSAGPYASYDIWRKEEFVINVFGSAQFVFVDMMDVEQEFSDGTSDSRSFSSYHIAPRAGLAVHKPKALFNALDLIGGISVNLEFSHTYTAQDEAEEGQLWKGDQFDQPAQTQLSYFIGLQSNY